MLSQSNEQVDNHGEALTCSVQILPPLAINKCLGTRWSQSIAKLEALISDMEGSNWISPTKLPPPPPLLLCSSSRPASATSIAAPMAKLLMLKEYLELDDDDGFVLGVGVATIRSLLDAELRRESALRNAACGAAAANGNVLGKFSAAIEAVKARCLPLSSRPERATFSALFWKKKKKDKKRRQGLTADQNASDAVGWHSLRFPSPVISSRPSHCSYAASPAPYYLQVTSSTGEERKEHSPPQSSSSQPSGNEEATSTTATLSPATVSNRTRIIYQQNFTSPPKIC